LLLRELLSALTIDFASILWKGKLDKEAIVDCASFMGAAICRKRDRSANMWGILLYFMLIVNFMFQAGEMEQKEVFVWMVKSVTRSTYEFNNHQSILDQLVLAIDKVLSTRSSPLNVKEDEVFFWHNYRTQCTPNAPIFNTTIRYYAFRMDCAVSVIKKVLGIHFSINEIYRAVEESDFAMKGKCHFYCCSSNTWPIANIVHDDVTNSSTKVPLTENELVDDMLKEYKAVFFKTTKFQDIISSVDKATRVDIDYEKIEINSANKEVGSYNFFESATGSNNKGWFGYRAIRECNFSNYCGGTNLMDVGGPSTYCNIITAIEQENEEMGFEDIYSMFDPATLREYYSYHFPDIESLPPVYKKIPFKMRNAENDIHVDVHQPPWLEDYFHNGGMGEVLDCPSSPIRNASSVVGSIAASPTLRNSNSSFSSGVSTAKRTRCFVDEELSECANGPSPNRRDPSSNPLADVTLGLNSSNGPSENRPIKRRAFNRFVVGEAECTDDEDDEEEEVSIS